MWKSNCDCGTCDDCNLAYDLAHRDLVAVSTQQWMQAVCDSDELAALEAAGVDNWEGYDIAMNELREDLRNES